MIEFQIYRALSDHEIQMKTRMSGNLLDTVMSRVMASSKEDTEPYLMCWTEDPRIAYSYSKKPGYSGAIATLTVIVCDDGELSVKGSDAELYRTWTMEDWLSIAKRCDYPTSAKNLNYKCKDRRLEDIITYKGRSTPRAYAHSDKGFVLHTSEPLNYRILTEDEIMEITNLSRHNFKSYRAIKYDFSDAKSQTMIQALIKSFKSQDQSKAYNRRMVEQLQKLIA